MRTIDGYGQFADIKLSLDSYSEISDLSNLNIISMSCGLTSALFLTDDDQIYVFGKD